MSKQPLIASHQEILRVLNYAIKVCDKIPSADDPSGIEIDHNDGHAKLWLGKSPGSKLRIATAVMRECVDRDVISQGCIAMHGVTSVRTMKNILKDTRDEVSRRNIHMGSSAQTLWREGIKIQVITEKKSSHGATAFSGTRDSASSEKPEVPTKAQQSKHDLAVGES